MTIISAMKKIEKGFGSDNFSGILPEVMQALSEANQGHVHGYGDDEYTQKATADIRAVLDAPQAEILFVFNGTGANALSLSLAAHSYHAVICPATAHIAVDECGAIERQVGCRLFTVPTEQGKLTVDEIEAIVREQRDDQHRSQPRVISISQCTELGTVYTPDEVRTLADYAHAHGMLLHMDGARLANATASLGCAPHSFITDAGVDILSFGGTKNGMMIGEAVVVLNPQVAADALFKRKQLTQLASKHRFIAAQFSAMLHDGLWLRSAAHANAMAHRLSEGLQKRLGITPSYPTQANAVFAELPEAWIAPLQEHCFFYVWEASKHVVRWVCSYDTTEAEVDAFLDELERYHRKEK